MSRKSRIHKRLFLPLLAALFCGTGSGWAADHPVGIRAALVPGANIAVMVNWSALRTSSILPPTLASLRAQSEKQAQAEEKQQFERLAQDILGLAPEDFVGLVYSVNISPLLQKGGFANPDPNELAMCGGLRLAKPVTLQAISELMRESARQQEKTVNMLRKQHGRDSLLIIREDAAGDDRPPDSPQAAVMKAVRMTVAVMDEGKAVFFGTEKGVTGALDRYHAETVLKPSAALLQARKLVPEGAQVLALIVPPEGLTKALQQSGAPEGDAAPNPMMGMMGMFAGMKGLSIALHAQEKLDVLAQLVLSSPQEAEQVRMMMEEMVLGSARSKLPRGKEGKELPAAQSMQVRRQESSVLFRMSISEEDIKSLGSALERAPEEMDEVPADGPRPLIF